MFHLPDSPDGASFVVVGEIFQSRFRNRYLRGPSFFQEVRVIYLHIALGELGPWKNQVLVMWQLSSARPQRKLGWISAPWEL